MNDPLSENTFVPRQALAPSPELYDEIVGDSMEQLARTSLAQMPPISSDAVIHDNGCGTGAATAAVMEILSGHTTKALIEGTDISDQALTAYKSRATDEKWLAQASKMPAEKLSFADNTFSHSIANAMIFVLPNDGIDGTKEMYRTLRPGGTVVVNSWAYVPQLEPLQTAARVTRPLGTPIPRENLYLWAPPSFKLL